MTASLVAVVGSTLALAGTVFSAWLGYRATRTGDDVARDAQVLEGYDELVRNLQADLAACRSELAVERERSARVLAERIRLEAELHALYVDLNQQRRAEG